jgi:hypothetical protein
VSPPTGEGSTGSSATGNGEGSAPASAISQTAPVGVGSAPGAVSEVRSVGVSSAPQQPPTPSRRERLGSAARRTDQALSRAAGHLRSIRNQLGRMPSDAAPHAPPPRMPIDHNE